MLKKRDVFNLVAIFVVAVLILFGTLAITGGELTASDVLVVAFAITIAAVLTIRIGAFLWAVLNL